MSKKTAAYPNLTEKAARFAKEYIVDLNATKAAIRAGYSPNSAYAHGTRLLKDGRVAAIVSELQQGRSKRTEITQDRVLIEIARLAFNDPRKAFNDKGGLLPIKEWPDEVAAAISAIKINEMKDCEGNVVGETKEIKFWDKSKNLDLAARHLGMLNDKLELNGSVTFTLDKSDQSA